MGRQFGIVADPLLAGTTYDDLPVGKAIPAPVQSWPVTNVTVAGGASDLERVDEMRGGRGTPAPEAYKRAPQITVTGRLYPELLAYLLLMALGATTRTGTAPAAFTDKLLPAADTAQQLPGVHLGWEMDGNFDQAAGCKLNALTCTFPLSGDATFSATFFANWHKPLTVAPTWAMNDSWLGTNEWALQLRDTAAFEGGSSTAVDCLRGFSIELPDIYRTGDEDRWCARKAREDVGTGNDFTRIWWPSKFTLSPRRQINGTAEFSGIDQSRELALRILKAQQFVIEADARPLATTPPSTEVVRFSLLNAVQRPSGDRSMNRDDRLDTPITWTAHNNASKQDVQVEWVNSRSTGIALPVAA
jgi:hypothetical protein